MTEENLAALSEVALASLALPNLINPVLDKVCLTKCFQLNDYKF